MLLGDFTIIPSRLDLIEFSVPLQSSELIIVKRKSNQKDTSLFAFLFPLSWTVWVAILAAILLGITLKLFASVVLKYFASNTCHESVREIEWTPNKKLLALLSLVQPCIPARSRS